jgi:hypothetical protein
VVQSEQSVLQASGIQQIHQEPLQPSNASLELVELAQVSLAAVASGPVAQQVDATLYGRQVVTHVVGEHRQQFLGALAAAPLGRGLR